MWSSPRYTEFHPLEVTQLTVCLTAEAKEPTGHWVTLQVVVQPCGVTAMLPPTGPLSAIRNTIYVTLI